MSSSAASSTARVSVPSGLVAVAATALVGVSGWLGHAHAQFGERVPVSGGSVVPVDITSSEFLRSFGRSDVDVYAPLLDMRRRIIANSWVRSMELRGPANSRSMSADVYREDATTCPYSAPYSCSPMSPSDVDRLEVYWGYDYIWPEDVVVQDDLNQLVGPRDTLHLPGSTPGESLLFPGAHLRFTSGPATIYPGGSGRRWSSMASLPSSEGSGFTINQAVLYRSGATPVRGFTTPLTLAAYERASVLLIGGSTGEDSVTFYIDPSVTRPTVSIRETTGDVQYAYARCGGLPSALTYDKRLAIPSAAVLDLTDGCTSYWQISLVSNSATGAQADVRIGALTPSSGPFGTGAAREYDIVVGLEVSATPGEIAYVRRAMRGGAWMIFGASGGTHMIRTLTYQMGCGGAHVCYRNVTGCDWEGDATTHPTGSTPSLAIDICRDISGFDASVTYEQTARQDASIMAHEYGHLIVSNGSLNQLPDEYWVSNLAAKVCGAEGVTLNRCNHSLMAHTSLTYRPRSFCVGENHMAAPFVLQQLSGTVWWRRLGSASVGWGTQNWTYSECIDGQTNQAGYGGVSAWEHMYGIGAVPIAHPSWTADNMDFWVFANSTSNVIGHSL